MAAHGIAPIPAIALAFPRNNGALAVLPVWPRPYYRQPTEPLADFNWYTFSRHVDPPLIDVSAG
jgi:hypothetical protein